MKNAVRPSFIVLFLTFSLSHTLTFSQKVGIGTNTPQGELHIKGTENVSQLCIDADTNQTNSYPMIRLRKSDGTDLMWIHADITTNLFAGLRAGSANLPAEGIRNTFIGSEAGFSNTSGLDNTALGNEVLRGNSTGNSNTGVGSQSLRYNSTGHHNTALGASALYLNSTGYNNTAIGTLALSQNTSGYSNIAIGSSSLLFNTTGYENTVVGRHGMIQNTIGVRNTAVGYNTLYQNTDGNNNTGVGTLSLTGNEHGSFNTATGTLSLANNFTGNHNEAFGSESLRLNTTGSGNAAFGYQALYNNVTQIQNTAFGNETLLNTTASGNTAVGFLAGHDFDNGDYNTYVGIYADANAAGFQNSTALGSSTNVTASNQVRIGTSVSSIGGPQNWTNTSDRRIKLNVREDVPGLAFINLLQPVTYNKSIVLEDEIIGKKRAHDISPDNTYETIRYSGFIAQDVEAAAQSIGYEFSGVDAPQNEKDLYGLRYAEFVVPLVKAVQELADEVEKLKKENDELRQLLQKTQ